MAGFTYDDVINALADVLEEIHVGPPNPKTTWVTTNAPDSGILGTLGSLPAETASRRPAPGMSTIAAHTAHLVFALGLARRSAEGEDAYAGADWAADWRTPIVDEEAWKALTTSLQREHAALIQALRTHPPKEGDGNYLKSMFALAGHGAYHLGAIRQIHRMLAARA
jgi:hypothetical protein